MVAAAGDNRVLPPLSIVGSFSPLPSLEYAGDSVVPEVCHLALGAVRAPLVAMRGDAQNDSRLATIPSGLGAVKLAELWPRCGVPELPLHDGRSDSPAR